jgi:hypothetical protein
VSQEIGGEVRGELQEKENVKFLSLVATCAQISGQEGCMGRCVIVF